MYVFVGSSFVVSSIVCGYFVLNLCSVSLPCRGEGCSV